MALVQRDERWTPPRERRWTVADGRALVTAFAARPAGETLAAFARRHGLVAQRVSWWRARIREADARAPAVKFARVSVVPARPEGRATRGSSDIAAGASAPPVEIVVGQRSVRVRAGFDTELLRRVLATLEEASSC